MAARRRTLRILTGAAAASLALVSTAWSRPVPPRPEARAAAAEAAGPATLCAPAGVLRGPDGERASVSLCAGSGTPVMAVSAPATCRRPGTSVRFACLTSGGTWTARRDGATVASGTLPGSQPYPGPGTYDVTATVHVRSAPAGVKLRGTVRATLTLSAPKRSPRTASRSTGARCAPAPRRR